MGNIVSKAYTRTSSIPVMSSRSSSEHDEVEVQTTQFLDGKPSQRWLHPTFSRLHVIIIVANLISFTLWLALSLGVYINSHQLNAELRQTSTWSPLHDLIDLKMHTETINGELYPGRNRPVARQMPNHEADAIWAEWELTRVFPISGEDVIRLGKDLETAVLLEDRFYGLGDNIYAATLDVYHQLHCVNQLRWIAYGAYYNRSTLNPWKEGFREVHINHCVDILVQALQCSGNVNLMTMHWTETKPYPFPDMSINRKCVDFDALTEWRKQNTVDLDLWVNNTGNELLRPENIVLRPPPDEEYNKIYSETTLE